MPQSSWRTLSGAFAPQGHLRVEQMGLELVIAQLDFPALVVQRDEFLGGIGVANPK